MKLKHWRFTWTCPISISLFLVCQSYYESTTRYLILHGLITQLNIVNVVYIGYDTECFRCRKSHSFFNADLISIHRNNYWVYPFSNTRRISMVMNIPINSLCCLHVKRYSRSIQTHFSPQACISCRQFEKNCVCIKVFFEICDAVIFSLTNVPVRVNAHSTVTRSQPSCVFQVKLTNAYMELLHSLDPKPPVVQFCRENVYYATVFLHDRWGHNMYGQVPVFIRLPRVWASSIKVRVAF